jgi:Leucine-rich repeat (LRR) protein
MRVIVIFFGFLVFTSCQHDIYKYKGDDIIIFNSKEIYGKKKIRGLDLSGDTSSIPEAVFSKRELIFLDLRDKKIKILPEKICSITSLKVLILTNNPLEELPECLFDSKLEILSLIGCGMYTIPHSLTRMPNLELLAIGGNKFSIGYLTQLEKEMPNTKIVHGID